MHCTKYIILQLHPCVFNSCILFLILKPSSLSTLGHFFLINSVQFKMTTLTQAYCLSLSPQSPSSNPSLNFPTIFNITNSKFIYQSLPPSVYQQLDSTKLIYVIPPLLEQRRVQIKKRSWMEIERRRKKMCLNFRVQWVCYSQLGGCGQRNASFIW